MELNYQPKLGFPVLSLCLDEGDQMKIYGTREDAITTKKNRSPPYLRNFFSDGPFDNMKEPLKRHVRHASSSLLEQTSDDIVNDEEPDSFNFSSTQSHSLCSPLSPQKRKRHRRHHSAFQLQNKEVAESSSSIFPESRAQPCRERRGVIVRFKIDRPLGMGITIDGIIDHVKVDGQAQKLGLGPSCRIYQLDNICVKNLKDIKLALQNCRANGKEECEFRVESSTPALRLLQSRRAGKP